MAGITRDKETIRQSTEALLQMTGDFCDVYLNQEYKELCEKVIRKILYNGN